MSVIHECSSRCIREDGSYCRELEAAIGIRPQLSTRRGVTPIDPSLLAHHLDRGCEWEDPTADEALG